MVCAFYQGEDMAEIQLRNLSKRWGSFVGVHEFDLTIADKEFLVLLGPSGCGKTTTNPFELNKVLVNSFINSEIQGHYYKVTDLESVYSISFENIA